VWQRTAAAMAPVVPHTGTTPRRTLLLSDGSAFGAALAQRLRDAGDEVTVATAGRAWRQVDPRRFTLDAGSGDDIERLFQAVLAVSPPPSRIVHLWNLPHHDVETTLSRGFYRLLQIAQIIGREDLTEPMALMVITRGAQRVAAETELDAAKATLMGPCKVIPREFANVRCALVDIDIPAAGSRIEQRLLDGLAAELDAAQQGPLTHDVIAWRAGERWVQAHSETPLPPPSASALRPQGVYLITGGLGGVGLALAEHLARRVQAKLVLIGRQGLPERSQWPDHLAGSSAGGDAVARRIRQVMAIEALGAEVLVIAADVTNSAQMKSALRHARARFGPLHGVMHTAGVLADGVIQLKDAAVAASVLAPKVQGTLALEAALADDAKAPPLDFLLLFSSISAFAGLAGQIDYAAANAFLDAYAQSRWTRGEGTTIAIDWSQWQEVGMAAELASQLGMAPDALAGKEGITLDRPLAQRLLLDTRDERVVETRLSRATHWLLEEHQVKDGEALIPGTGYLEIVRQAFTVHAADAPQGAIELRQVTFLTPFVVRQGQERDLRVHLRGLNTAVATFSIVGRAAGAAHAHDAWTEHVRGQVKRTTVAPAAHDSVADIAARCLVRTQDVQRAPEHLLFGPRWSNVHRIDFGHDEALLSLELPLAFVADLSEFALHPALMDMATGGAQDLVPGFDARRDFFVPAMYGHVRIHGPLTALLTSHVRRRAEAHEDDKGSIDIARFDVTIRDASGRVVVEVDDFMMIRVRDKAVLARTVAAAPAPANKPRATANNVLALGLRDGIASAEGAEAIERLLASPPGPQVVVSPQDLIALLARLRQSAAPVAATDVAEASADYKPPTTALEKTIAQMWGEMLGHARVGADDDFFDLGGHSLLAVQVINKLKKATGKAVPLTALLEAPTVRTLAALIEPGGGEPSDGVPGSAPAAAPAHVVRSATLIPVRAASGKPPLFFVHDGLGETLLYRNLALRLEPGHPVYGIQPETNERGEYAQTTIRDWAAAHIRTLRRVQPQGPYLIAGLCAGGVIAVEMARQLQEAGEKTAYVGILDAADAQLSEITHRIRNERLQRLKRLFAPEGGTPTPLSILRALPTLGAKALRTLRYELSTRRARAAHARQVERLRNQNSAAAVAPDAPRIGYLPLYEHAHREHQPGTTRLQGLFALYRATRGDGTAADQPYIERYGDAQLGWGPRVAQPLEVTDVPGGHASLLQEPNVQRLAEAMNAHLARAVNHTTSTGAQDTAPAPRPASAQAALQPADVDA
jgi:thioesterase domain-containing protein/NAD(P)-dependent dehydrogenase (short-subunit alcohol dehydrogenase family)/acyl carrier protein